MKIFYLMSFLIFVPGTFIAMESTSIQELEKKMGLQPGQLATSPALSAFDDLNKFTQNAGIPIPPPQPATSKKTMPPAPQQPSFIQRNKKALIWGGIGAGTLLAAGIVWQATKKNNAQNFDLLEGDEYA